MTTLTYGLQEFTPNLDGVSPWDVQRHCEYEANNFVRRLHEECHHHRFINLEVGRTDHGWWQVTVDGCAGATAIRMYFPPTVNLLAFLPRVLERGGLAQSCTERVVKAAQLS